VVTTAVRPQSPATRAFFSARHQRRFFGVENFRAAVISEKADVSRHFPCFDRRGIVDNNENRHRSLMFRWTVELNMLMHVIANHFGGDPISLYELRGYAVDEVKRINGQISFDNALKIQRMPQIEVEPWQD